MATRTLTWENASEDFDPDEPRDLVQLFRDAAKLPVDELTEEDAVMRCVRCGELFLDIDDANAHTESLGHRTVSV
jgi:hypothetical protein